jgi:hypothetical protein
MVAKAAELAGDRLIDALKSDLIAAYRRFLEDPAKRDPGCTAKGAFAEPGAYRNDARLRERLGGVVAERDDPRLGAGCAKAFALLTPGA